MDTDGHRVPKNVNRPLSTAPILAKKGAVDKPRLTKSGNKRTPVDSRLAILAHFGTFWHLK